MLTDKAEKIFKLKYAKEKETWADACLKVAEYIASAEETEEKRLEYTEKFFKLIYNLVFLPGGRILANGGTEIKNLLNCFVLPIEDSRISIYDTLGNAAEIFAHGGGVGYNFSKVREENAEIKSTGGKASGPLSFMTLFDQTGEVIQQASRRGAQLGCLNVDHPDILKFINYKSTPNSKNARLLEEYKRNLESNGLDKRGTKYFKVLEKTLQDDQLSHFNISVMVNDDFMRKAMEKDEWNLLSRIDNKINLTINADEILTKISEMCWESGDPGVLFYDRINEDNLVKYLGNLESTNPCVAGDTLILTVYDGGVPIKDLKEDTLIYTWNPDTKLPEVSMMRNIGITRENVEVLEIEFDSGLKLKCTPDHNLYNFRGEKIQAKDLKEGQSVRAYSTSIHRDGHLRVHGWTDGKTQHKYVARLVWEFFNGKIEGDLILHHKDFNKLNNRIENFELLSNSLHNSVHYPDRKAKGFTRLKGAEEFGESLFKNHKVVSIKKAGKEDVYNGVVDNTHTYIIADEVPVSGLYSGIISANCGEVPLLPYEPCCLGSINLHAFYEEENNSIDFESLEFVVRTAVRFLDNVQTLSEISLEEVNKWSKGLRRLGLGVMGLADLLAELEIPYNSQDALELSMYLSWFITFFGWLESMNLAKEKGSFPFYEKDKIDFSHLEKVLYKNPFVPYRFNLEDIKENGLRNVAITSIAPTGTISLLANVNSGIEPFFALAYKRNITQGVGNTAKDYVIEINPILYKKLKKYGFTEKEIDEIKEKVYKTGSISSIEEIPEKLRNSLLVSYEISPQNHVDMQAMWQQFIDNSISKTINVPEDYTVEDIKNIFIYMWNQNLKGGTVYRNNSKTFQILNIGISGNEN